MGKRSEFKKRPQDKYFTPYAGVVPLVPFLEEKTEYAEVCAGNGQLIRHLAQHGHDCIFACDVEPEGPDIKRMDALEIRPEHLPKTVSTIITNPPWSRDILHSLIKHLPTLKPTWLLFDADWMHTRQAASLILTCSVIVSVGRLKWIEGSKFTGKDNCCWYFFPGNGYVTGPEFYGRESK